MNIIVAVDRKGGIGCKGKLLFELPSDLAYFKEKTTGKTVIMGYNTYQSLPFKPLKNRKNIVLAGGRELQSTDNLIVCQSINEVFSEIITTNTADVFVIGGESVYNLFNDYCEYAYVTEVEAEAEADTFYNGFRGESWQRISTSPLQLDGEISYRFSVYKNQNVKAFG